MPDFIINNNISSDKNDWRYMGQEKYLKSATLGFAKYVCLSENWNHEHCEFCMERFSENNGDLNEGYYTLDDKKHWICKECFNDFKEMFEWTVVRV